MADSLAPDAVKPLLRGRFGHVYLYMELVPSTQRVLREETEEGAVAVAEEQSEGRGRLGRSWGCPALREAVARNVIDTVRGGGVIFC